MTQLASSCCNVHQISLMPQFVTAHRLQKFSERRTTLSDRSFGGAQSRSHMERLKERWMTMEDKHVQSDIGFQHVKILL